MKSSNTKDRLSDEHSAKFVFQQSHICTEEGGSCRLKRFQETEAPVHWFGIKKSKRLMLFRGHDESRNLLTDGIK